MLYSMEGQFWLLWCRSLEPGRPKRLYFVSSGVKHLLQNDDREALKVTMTGLKVFERQELKVQPICFHCVW